MAVPLREVSDEAWADLAQKARVKTDADQRTLPITRDLQRFFPNGIQRGTAISVTGSAGLALQVVAAATTAGSWCAAVGQGRLNCVAAAEAGVSLDRFAVINEPGVKWTNVVAALLDGFDMVLVSANKNIRENDVRRLAARARQRGSVLVVSGLWPQADVRLHVDATKWSGLGNGHGYLTDYERRVTAQRHGVPLGTSVVKRAS